jgi:hypothetical protein
MFVARRSLTLGLLLCGVFTLQVSWEFWTNSNDECGLTCDKQKKFVKVRAAAESSCTCMNWRSCRWSPSSNALGSCQRQHLPLLLQMFLASPHARSCNRLP